MEKLSWADLRKAIAQRINTDEKEVGTFMSALAPAIIQALQEERQVRITNFGTFKLQSIAPRRSVNVATGEAFTLPGYDKLTFTPETSVKELIGNLDSRPSPIHDESTPLRKLGEQATEIVDILNDLGQSPKKEAAVDEKPVVSEPPVVDEEKEEPIKENSSMSKEKHLQESQQEPQEKKNEKKNRTWLVVGITVLLFAVVLALVFLFIGNKFVAWVEGLHNKDVQIEVVATPEEIVEDLVPQSTLPYPLTYTEFIAQEYLPEGSRLAWLARKYYGNRDLWVFIYEANKNVVEHPSLIQIGTLIKVPKLPAEMMDFSNPELQQLVDRLAEEYKKL